MDDRLFAERVVRTFRALVIAQRSIPTWSTPQRGHDEVRYAPGSRHGGARAMRPVGMGSERLYWSTRPPLRPRGWAGRASRRV